MWRGYQEACPTASRLEAAELQLVVGNLLVVVGLRPAALGVPIPPAMGKRRALLAKDTRRVPNGTHIRNQRKFREEGRMTWSAS